MCVFFNTSQKIVRTPAPDPGSKKAAAFCDWNSLHGRLGRKCRPRFFCWRFEGTILRASKKRFPEKMGGTCVTLDDFPLILAKHSDRLYVLVCAWQIHDDIQIITIMPRPCGFECQLLTCYFMANLKTKKLREMSQGIPTGRANCYCWWKKTCTTWDV